MRARRFTALFRVGLVGLAVGIGCGEPASETAPFCSSVTLDAATFSLPSAPPDAAPRDFLRASIEGLAAPALRGRHAGGIESDAVAAALAARLAEFGFAPPPRQDSSYCQAFALYDETDQNVVGHLFGKDEDRPVVLVGAHYDGQGLTPRGEVYPSADDNASGVAALLEIARRAAAEPPPVDLVVVFFGGEETGLAGSGAWVERPSVPLGKLRLMINLDMVGRPWPVPPTQALGYLPMGREESALEGLARAAAKRSGVETRRLDQLFARSDLLSDSERFHARIPTLYVSSGLHEDHHAVTDTVDQVDLDQVERAVRFVLGLLEAAG